MVRDRFTFLTCAGLAVALLVLVSLALYAVSGDSALQGNAELEQAMNQQIAYQARIDFLQRIYAPVEEARQRQSLPEALLKLEEIARSYPGEAHGLMLKGDILYQQGALSQALENIARGLRINGDYVDPKSPLQQRELITALATEGQQKLAERLRVQPDNPGLERSLKDAYYLQSRLAGGCE